MDAADFSTVELALATRNHGMPLEALRYDLTPVGLHYLLIHFDIPQVDAETWRLEIGGEVRNPLSLSLDDVKQRPSASLACTLECAGNGRARLTPRPLSQPWLEEAVGNAEWTGTPLAPLLEEAGVADAAVEVLFTGLDRGIQGEVEHAYERSLPLDEALRPDVLLAYEVNGQPLPPQHGYPVRLLVPDWYGMCSVKWLRRITAVGEPFDGFQLDAYQLRQEQGGPGARVTKKAVRALMVPPGFSSFPGRQRFLDAGPHRLTGRAWSGSGHVVRVEVSVDGGGSWSDAELGPAPSSFTTWRGWSFGWDASPGEHELVVRATDETGGVQPLDPPWNYGGFMNNMVQRVPVLVR